MSSEKRAVLLHGTDGLPQENWLPWLKQQLEELGYTVWVPLLPENHSPDRHRYNDFLFNSDWDFTNSLVIGHSSGAVSILNLLEDERCPHVKTGVLAGAWARLDEADLTEGIKAVFGSAEEVYERFKGLFPPGGFDFKTITSRVNELLFVHSDNDPYCPLDQAKWLAKQTGSELVVVPGGQHFSASIDPAFTTFTELLETLKARQLV
jgi:predicted alpha/beta hydrolase family esterase